MQKPRLLMAAVITLSMIISCRSGSEKNSNIADSTTTDVAKAKPDLGDVRICASRAPLPAANFDGSAAAAMEEKKWKWGAGKPKNINVVFLDGSTKVIEKVKAIAKTWEPFAKVKFVFTADKTKADIKISFHHSEGGSWSYLGIDARQFDTSMNFGWLETTPLTDDDEFNRVVLHEFGHALGLIHEHQNPNENPIRWKVDMVYAYFLNGGGFSDSSQVKSNILDMEENVRADKFDDRSIMLYSFPAKLTEDGYSAPWNTKLSDGDKRFIFELYKP